MTSKVSIVSLLLLLIILFYSCRPVSLNFQEGGIKKLSGSFYIRSEGIKRSGSFVTRYDVKSGTSDMIQSGKSYFYSALGPRILTMKETIDSVELHPRGEDPFTISTGLLLNLGEGFPHIPITYATFLRTMKGKLPLEVELAMVEDKSDKLTVPIKNSKFSWKVLIRRKGERIENITLSLADNYTITFISPGAGYFTEVTYTSNNSDYIKIRYDS